MLRYLGVFLLLPALIAGSGAAVAETWILDPATTAEASVSWQGKPIAVRFPGLSGEVEFDSRHLDVANATLSVPTGAATTGNPIVDAMMRSPDYLDAAGHPTITFELDKLTRTSDDTADVAGRVTLRGVTRPVRLTAKVIAFGEARADFAITGQIDRRDFGSTAGVPEVAAVLPLDIRLVMTAR